MLLAVNRGVNIVSEALLADRFERRASLIEAPHQRTCAALIYPPPLYAALMTARSGGFRDQIASSANQPRLWISHRRILADCTMMYCIPDQYSENGSPCQHSTVILALFNLNCTSVRSAQLDVLRGKANCQLQVYTCLRSTLIVEAYGQDKFIYYQRHG